MRALTCGEIRAATGACTTHALDYNGVAIRGFAELPKLSRARKEATHALSTALPVYAEKLHDILSNDEPLIYKDFKSVPLVAQHFKDMRADRVFDIAVGNTTAAIAAWARRYFVRWAVCHARAQRVWGQYLR